MNRFDVETSGNGHAHGPPQADVATDVGIDAGLIAVIQAWPHLPEAIRAGIIAMVRVAARH